MAQEIHLQIDLRLTRRSLRAGLVLLVMAFCAADLGSESVQLTTYYPAPSGIYTKMITTQDTYLDTTGTGKVGIGTMTPGYTLTVNGTYSNPQVLVTQANATGNNGLFFHAQGASANYNWLIGQQRTVSGLEFTPSSAAGGASFTTPSMVFTSPPNPKVGIGTITPQSRLDVLGSVHINATAGCGSAMPGSVIPADSGGGEVPLCGPNNYATWFPGIFVEGYMYENHDVSTIIATGYPGAGTRASTVKVLLPGGTEGWAQMTVGDEYYFCCPMY